MGSKWTLKDLKDKGIFVNSDGIGKKLDKPKTKKVKSKDDRSKDKNTFGK